MATYPAVYDAGSSDRGPSTRLWQHFPADTNHDDPRHGWTHFDDCHVLPAASDYTTTQDTTGTFTLDTTVGNIGVWLFDTVTGGSAGDGINVQFDGYQITPAAGRKVGFECLVKATDIATGPMFFAGLAIIDTTIVTATDVDCNDCIGFASNTDDGVLLFHTEDSNVEAVGTTSPHTFVDGTYVKLGFLAEGLDSVTVFVDGIETSVGTLAPEIGDDTVLVPSFVSQTDGSTDSVIHMDWYKVGTVN